MTLRPYQSEAVERGAPSVPVVDLSGLPDASTWAGLVRWGPQSDALFHLWHERGQRRERP